MSEQAPTQNTADYLAQHPNAIVDPAKAGFVAYATKEHEEKIPELKKEAMSWAEQAASNVSSYSDGSEVKVWNEKIKKSVNPAEEAERITEEAIKTRNAADKRAQIVGETYDKIKNL